LILVTGGAGFIGSHTCVALAEAGMPYLVLDNFCNSKPSVLERIGRITGHRPMHVEGDVRDAAFLDRVLAQHRIRAVIHFAALKAVGESVREPLHYYDNNVAGTVTLLHAMRRAGVRTLVFSSSATVYGEPAALPIREDFALSAANPYGWSKLMVEQVLANLLPYVAQVAAGRRERLSVYGNDYPTPDGTGVRDYIHVCDLAEGHVAALRYLERHPGLLTVNLGTGTPISVLEMVRAFEQASGRAVPYQVVARRPGDVAQCWADPSLAGRLLGWRARHGVERMCQDAWRWQAGEACSLE